MAVTGERCFGCTRARKWGKAPIRPIAYAVLVETFTPAFALAMVELTMPRNTKNQNAPYKERAMPTQDAAPVPVVKVWNWKGPNATSTA